VGIPEKEDANSAIQYIHVITQKEKNDYIERRAIPTADCRGLQKLWVKALKNEKYVCLLGNFVDQEKDKSGQIKRLWIFEKFKTRTACVTYTEVNCSVKNLLKNLCDV
jgi:hypothetical protein